jgi:hypothetical protein
MNVATLPDYRSLKTPIPGGPENQGKFWNRRRRVVIDLIAVGAIAAILYEFRQLRRAIDRPWLDRDVRHVFELIPARYEYRQLSKWCGLVETNATPTEGAMILEKFRSSQSMDHYLTSPFADFIGNRIMSEKLIEAQGWIRLSDPNDSNQWIGICVIHIREESWIVCRVPIGF